VLTSKKYDMYRFAVHAMNEVTLRLPKKRGSQYIVATKTVTPMMAEWLMDISNDHYMMAECFPTFSVDGQLKDDYTHSLLPIT